MKVFATLVLTFVLCLTAVAFAEREETLSYDLTEGYFVGESEEIKPGWYTATPIGDDKYHKLSIFDCRNLEQPAHVASYSWSSGGDSLLADEDEEVYTFPLWEGCMVISNYHSGFEVVEDPLGYRCNWQQYEEQGTVRLEFVAPLSDQIEKGLSGFMSDLSQGAEIKPSATPTVEPSAESAEKSMVLFEDERIKVSFSDFHVESFNDGSAYIKTEWMIENKTDEIIDVTCDSITVNGCAVQISKFADVPPKSKYLNEWTNSAEQFLKFGIDEVKTFSAILTIGNGRKIQSNEITLE